MSEDEPNRCEKHDVDLDSLPPGYSRCPYCEQEERLEAERRHMMTRDPTREPY